MKKLTLLLLILVTLPFIVNGRPKPVPDRRTAFQEVDSVYGLWGSGVLHQIEFGYATSFPTCADAGLSVPDEGVEDSELGCIKWDDESPVQSHDSSVCVTIDGSEGGVNFFVFRRRHLDGGVSVPSVWRGVTYAPDHPDKASYLCP
jgi:hypothetical protein